MTTNLEIARKFVDKINAHDVKGLVALMTADHVFVDSLGDKFTRPSIEAGWKQYFAMVPDYWIRIDRMVVDNDNALILIGMAGGTYAPEGGVMKPENKWQTPAVWNARIRGEKVSEWRIYSDNEPIRAIMRRSNL